MSDSCLHWPGLQLPKCNRVSGKGGASAFSCIVGAGKRCKIKYSRCSTVRFSAKPLIQGTVMFYDINILIVVYSVVFSDTTGFGALTKLRYIVYFRHSLFAWLIYSTRLRPVYRFSGNKFNYLSQYKLTSLNTKIEWFSCRSIFVRGCAKFTEHESWMNNYYEPVRFTESKVKLDRGCVSQKHRNLKYIIDPLKPMELRSTNAGYTLKDWKNLIRSSKCERPQTWEQQNPRFNRFAPIVCGMHSTDF